MTKKAKLYIKRIFLLIFAFALEGVLGFLLIDGIANHDLAESKVIILIIVLILLSLHDNKSNFNNSFDAFDTACASCTFVCRYL